MEPQDKMRLLEEVMDLESGTLQADTSLDDVEEWDSLAAISFISLLDSKLNKEVDLARLKRASTVSDLLMLM